jgi:colanic acid/amylovoran biosynthesis glycosyltransferase
VKILLINQEHAAFGGPGGAERSVQSIAEHFVKAGHEVTFLCMARRVYMRDMPESGLHSVRDLGGVKTILMGRPNPSSTHADLLLPVILSERPDVIHTNVFHRAPQLWRAMAPLGIPVLHSLREYKLMCDRNLFDGVRDCGEQCGACELGSQFALQMSRHVDGVVGISSFTLQRHLAKGFFAKAAVARVIPNSYRPKNPPRPRVPRAAGAPIRIGFLGRLHASKGINLIIDVMSKLRPDAASLIMAGDLQDPEIASRVQALSATHDARFIGFADPEEFFPQIDVLLAPSIWHEPFGRITIEAFSHRVPVIATNRGGLPDTVTHGESGWIFDPDQPQQLAEIIEGLADMPEDRLEEMRDAALAASQHYVPEIVGERYLAAYRELIDIKAKTTSLTVKRLRGVYERDVARAEVERSFKTNLPARIRRPLKILVMTGEFPKLSESFVLNHITGLIDLGHDVRVLHTRPSRMDQMPPDYHKYGLSERSTMLQPPDRQILAINQLVRPGRMLAAKLPSLRGGSADSLGEHGETLEMARDLLQRSNETIADYHAAHIISHTAADVDLVHCHFGHRPKMVFRYMDLGAFSAPVVCSFHGIDVSAHIQRFGTSLYDDVKRRLHKALPVSEFFRDRLISLGFEPKDVQVHRVGIDTTKFSFARRHREDGETLNIISVARLVYKKGMEYGILAVAKAMERRPDLRVRYLLVGEGEEKEKLEALVASLGVGRHVSLLGSQPHAEVTRLMAAAHVMMVPSVTGPDGDMEGIPTVAMEAMATGLPVLSTFHSGIPEAVVDGYTGLLSPEHDVEALASNIIYLYDNRDLGPQLGRQGRAHVMLEFNIVKQNQKALELYERIVTGRED